MSWVNEDACLQVLEKRELNDQLDKANSGRAPPRPVPRVVQGAVRLSPKAGRRSALCRLRRGLPEKEQRSARLPGSAASKLQAPKEEKGQCAFPSSKPSPGTATHGGGRGRLKTQLLTNYWQSGRGCPIGTRASVPEEAAWGLVAA